jgi:hypothetical protein
MTLTFSAVVEKDGRLRPIDHVALPEGAEVAVTESQAARRGIITFMNPGVGLKNSTSVAPQPSCHETPEPPVEWLGRLGDVEPNPYAAMTPAERLEMVWPLTVTAWAFSGKACDESRLRRDVECVSHRRG